jgi:hypothetical protein
MAVLKQMSMDERMKNKIFAFLKDQNIEDLENNDFQEEFDNTAMDKLNQLKTKKNLDLKFEVSEDKVEGIKVFNVSLYINSELSKFI